MVLRRRDQLMLKQMLVRIPSDAQLAYLIKSGKRFTLGFPDDYPRDTVAVISANADWIEYDLEDRQGRVIEPRRTMQVRVAEFRASILEALTPLSESEIIRRGYREQDRRRSA
jgi:hypothetical protein